MKNICFYINTLGASGGTQKLLVFLANLLSKTNNVTIIVTHSAPSFYQLNQNIKVVGLKPKSGFKPLKLIALNYAIYSVLKRNNIHYYINLDTNTVILNGLFLPFRTKLVIWEHFSLSNNVNKLFFKVSRWYAAKRAFKFVCLFNNEVLLWEKHYGLNVAKAVVVNNPITVNLPNVLSNIIENKTFLAIGNNIQVKGFDLLLKAWKNVKPNGWNLEIIGLDPKNIQELDTYIQNNNITDVTLTGRLKNIEKKYQTGAVFCLTSRKEAYPLVLIESQAFGLPAILFDSCPGAMEIVEHSNSSILVNSYDIEQLTIVIQDIIDAKHDLKKLSDNAIKNSKNFSVDVFEQHWLKILEL